MSTRLFVGNIVFNATDEDVRALFSEAGTVEDVAMINDKFTGRPRGFAFVTMASQEEADAAVQKFEGFDYQGRPLKVNEARPREERPEGGFGGGPRGEGGFRPRKPFNPNFGGPRRSFGGPREGGFGGGEGGGEGEGYRKPFRRDGGGSGGGFRPRTPGGGGFRPRFKSEGRSERSEGGYSDNY